MSFSTLAYWCANDCVVMCHLCIQVCYLAVHDEVADAAGEVFVLKLRVDVGYVLVDTTKLEHVAHVQVSKTHIGMKAKISIQTTLLTTNCHIHVIWAELQIQSVNCWQNGTEYNFINPYCSHYFWHLNSCQQKKKKKKKLLVGWIDI